MEAFKPRFFISGIGARLSRSQMCNVAITHLDKAYHITYAGMGNLASAIQLSFTWGTEEIQMLVAANNLCEFIDPELQGLVFEDLSEELQSVLIQVLGETLKDIFAQFHQPLTFNAGSISKNEQPVACLNISDETRSIITIGITSNNGNIAFWQAIAKTISSEQILHMSLDFCFDREIGGVCLTLDELRGLRLGDVLLNQWQKDVVRFTYGHFAFLGKKENNNISVIKGFMSEKEDLPVGIIPDETEPQTTEELAEEQPTEASEPVEATPTASLDGLPVNITFQMGQQTLTLEQLQQVNEGYVFELTPNADEMINIVANGQIIGQGRWVQVEDHTGVQVTHLATK